MDELDVDAMVEFPLRDGGGLDTTIVVLITTVTVEGVLHTDSALSVASRRCSTTLLPELVVTASSETLDENTSAEEPVIEAVSSRELVGVVKIVVVSVLGKVLVRG